MLGARLGTVRKLVSAMGVGNGPFVALRRVLVMILSTIEPATWDEATIGDAPEGPSDTTSRRHIHSNDYDA